MRTLPMFQVDAFTDQLFKGNPAAVVPLDQWLPDQTMQAIAEENNLSETAFFVPTTNGYHIRWFTPACEVDLCGHATLATAYVIFEMFQHNSKTIRFESRSGRLVVQQAFDAISLEFPASQPVACEMEAALCQGLGQTPNETFKAADLIALFDNETQVRNLKPDFTALAKLDCRGIICTAPGDHVDFVSRFFGPAVGVNEDPVTGSAHCQLTPFWAARLGKNTLEAEQVSARGGRLLCSWLGERVLLTGQARLYMKGEFYLD